VTHYETLGVAPDAEDLEIEQAYRKLALEHHPDRVPPDLKSDAEQRFDAATEAFRVLSHPGRRAQYDAQIGHRNARRPNISPDDEKAFWRDLPHLQGSPEEALQRRRLRTLGWKKPTVLALGVLAVLAAFSALLFAGGRWAEVTGKLLSWHTSNLAAHSEPSVIEKVTEAPVVEKTTPATLEKPPSPRITASEKKSPPKAADTKSWRLEGLRLDPLSPMAKQFSPNADVALRGSIKGLQGCYVFPVQGAVVAEDGKRATIRIELRRLTDANKSESYLGGCTTDSASIEAHLEGDIRTWETVDLVAVDMDTGIERRFPAPELQWVAER
jgi:hypothetical protein